MTNVDRLRIMLPSDVFPPRCGGAGWSAHALALALIERGHHVTAIVPRQGQPGTLRENVLGVPTLRWGYRAPRVPFVQNYWRHERLWPQLADVLIDEALRDSETPLVIHAQHVQTTPPSIIAGKRLGAPVVVTVRDHWPWDYFATGLHANQLPFEKQTWATLATDLVARLGPASGSAALAAMPYMREHLRRRQRFLQQAHAVIAVSGYVAQRLAGIVAPQRLHVIPNMLDLDAIDATIATPPASVEDGRPYLLFVGKLEHNKGAHLLVDIFREFVATHPGSLLPELLIAGSGPSRAPLEHALRAMGVRVRFLDWIDHDETLRLMARCTLLLFPSAWGDPLSRVLLEACGCGAPILAMPTGGTPDIIADGINGVLAPTPSAFARQLAALLAQPERRAQLGAAGRSRARECFAHPVVADQILKLYSELL